MNSQENKTTNQILMNLEKVSKNSADLTKSVEKNQVEVNETVGDLSVQYDQLIGQYPGVLKEKFNGEQIEFVVWYHNGVHHTTVEFFNCEMTVEKVLEKLANTVNLTFSTLKKKGKMNIGVRIENELYQIKGKRVFHMNRKNLYSGSYYLGAINMIAYLKGLNA